MYQGNDPDGLPIFKKIRKRFEHLHHARELTFSCFRGYRFFSRQRPCQWFVDSLANGLRSGNVSLWCWVIMPEHIHLIVAPNDQSVKIGEWIGRVKSDVGRKAVAWLQRESPDWLDRIRVQEGAVTRHRFWQPGGGYDRQITNAATLLKMIDYIHMNPVRRGLVNRPEEWEWSSAAEFSGLPPSHLSVDRTLPHIK